MREWRECSAKYLVRWSQVLTYGSLGLVPTLLLRSGTNPRVGCHFVGLGLENHPDICPKYLVPDTQNSSLGQVPGKHFCCLGLVPESNKDHEL